MEIRHVTRSAIDETRWNGCIDSAANGLVYCRYQYLDALCTNWDALILGNYEAVMPLPWRRKWGVRYVYTPAFIQQLGIVGQTGSATEQAFVAAMHRFCRYGDYHFNDQNTVGATRRTNLVLPLLPTYETVRASYSEHHRRQLRKAAAGGLRFEISQDISGCIENFRNLFAGGVPGTTAKDLLGVARFCAANPANCTLRQVTDQAGRIVATALMLLYKNRYTLLMPAVLPEGKKLAAGHFLIDGLIREKAGTAALLDFEGSDIPGVQRFYAGFGAVDRPYAFYRWNQLRAPFRWIKK